MKPYIGITDFMSIEQVQRMLAVFKEHKPLTSLRQLHVGVMMSYKTMKGIPNKWSQTFPAKEAVAGIFGSDDAYNCLHYADYNGNTADVDLTEAIMYGDTGIDALQLDMPWPDAALIAQAVHMSHKHIEVILQIGGKAFGMVEDDPQKLLEWLRPYEGIIHRVLLDKSMGRGLGMDAVGLLPFARAIKKKFPQLGIVVAGGLGPTTMDLVKSFLAEFPDVSIDAQGKLRPSGNALDPIEWDMAEEYLIKALEVLK